MTLKLSHEKKRLFCVWILWRKVFSGRIWVNFCCSGFWSPSGLPNHSPKFQTLSDALSKKSYVPLKKSDTTYLMETVYSNSVSLLWFNSSQKLSHKSMWPKLIIFFISQMMKPARKKKFLTKFSKKYFLKENFNFLFWLRKMIRSDKVGQNRHFGKP